MKKIKLTQGKYAIVDADDYEWLNQWKWCYTHGYGVRNDSSTNKRKIVYMHRIINKTPRGKITDHINMNGLDNRRSNLRTTDKSGNSINRGLQKNNTSGYKGVSWSKVMKAWESYIWKDGIKIELGYSKNIQDAYFLRQKAEKIYHAI